MADSQRCIDTIRVLSADIVQKANSGHPGAPMGMAPAAHLLFKDVMRYSPQNPKWFNRDRFVLSNGHASALLYTMLHLTGYEQMTMDQLKQFRQLHSCTPGHPENEFDGVEVTTGPLGQGISNAIGMAIAQRHLAATFNRDGFPIIDNKVYVFCGDGCLQEGVASEACSLAGHLGLGNIVVLYDDNQITIDGGTDLSFTEDVMQRFQAYGWHTQTVVNGDTGDVSLLKSAVEAAQGVTDKPSIIAMRTTIGFGAKLEGTSKVHGSPLGNEDLANVKTKFGFDPNESFVVPDEVRQVYSEVKTRGAAAESEWNALFAKYTEVHSDLAKELQRRIDGKLPNDWNANLPSFTGKNDEATRKASQKVLQALAVGVPELISGSADLTPSNNNYLECSHDFQKDTPEGRNFRYGVREHAMCSIANGMDAYGGVIPCVATFLNFIGYALGAVTLAALSGHHVLYVFTHDSIGLGEDGPTHQPVEKYSLCRATPGLYFYRPCDGNECAGAYEQALQHKAPAVLSLTRQNLTQVCPDRKLVANGAYVLKDAVDPKVIIAATGSEVSLALGAADALSAKGVAARVVSMPCWELFEEQPQEYKEIVFAPGVPVLSVEAGVSLGWERYAHASVALDRFGLSAPASDVFADLGFTVESVADKAEKLIAHYADKSAESLVQRLKF